MAETARTKPLPGSGSRGNDSGDWIHNLTPTLSDEAMFDEEGRIQPLQVWPTESEKPGRRADLRLVKGPADDKS